MANEIIQLCIIGYCKKCKAKPAHPQYGDCCEDCFADSWGGVTDIYKEDGAAPTDTEKENILELPISELSLPMRTQNTLNKVGIDYVEDLVALSEEELLVIPNIGPAAMDKIKKRLKALCLVLSDTPRF
ncbi:MAG: DNA-directed RNA polymerase subunit alpha C-terminal domain-containing protein [Patescibacteria group bacterium]